MTHKNLPLSGIGKLAKEVLKDLGSQGRVLGLVGPLGSGKTTFTQALAKTLKVTSAKSPTFTIVHCYKGPKKSLYHIDLYRLEKAKELVAIGMDEILDDTESFTAIEWVDKFPSLMKKCDVILKFKVKPNNLRDVTVTYR